MLASMRTETRPSSRVRLLAILLVLLVGQGVGAASILVVGPPAGVEATFVPPWVFVAIWWVLYPSFALATAEIWHRRARPEARVALALGACALVVIVSWMPIACVADDLRVNVLLDLQAWFVVWTTAAIYRRVAPRSGGPILPLVIWMPITTALSVAAALIP